MNCGRTNNNKHFFLVPLRLNMSDSQKRLSATNEKLKKIAGMIAVASPMYSDVIDLVIAYLRPAEISGTPQEDAWPKLAAACSRKDDDQVICGAHSPKHNMMFVLVQECMLDQRVVAFNTTRDERCWSFNRISLVTKIMYKYAMPLSFGWIGQQINSILVVDSHNWLVLGLSNGVVILPLHQTWHGPSEHIEFTCFIEIHQPVVAVLCWHTSRNRLIVRHQKGLVCVDPFTCSVDHLLTLAPCHNSCVAYEQHENKLWLVTLFDKQQETQLTNLLDRKEQLTIKHGRLGIPTWKRSIASRQLVSCMFISPDQLIMNCSAQATHSQWFLVETSGRNRRIDVHGAVMACMRTPEGWQVPIMRSQTKRIVLVK